MRRVAWLVLCSAMAYSLFFLAKFVAADLMDDAGVSALMQQRTIEGMEDLRLGYELDRNMDRAAVRSRLLLKLMTVAPPRFKWRMAQVILHIAGEQVALHPFRAEAWAMMANAQAASGQWRAERRSVRRCLELEPFGTTLRPGL